MITRFIIIINCLLIFSSFNNSNQRESLVYTCDHPEVKCYYKEPCPMLNETCEKYNGTLYKMPESRAKANGKNLCDCIN